MANDTPSYYTNDGSTGYYKFFNPTPSGPQVNPIETAAGWSAFVADGYPIDSADAVTGRSIRNSILTATLSGGNNVLVHGLTGLNGGPVAPVWINNTSTPSGAIYNYQAADNENVYVNSAVAQVVTLSLFY